MQELVAFAQKLDNVLPRLRNARRAALEDAGEEMLASVRGRIGGTGKVQRWQEKHMGSGGGYVAVRPEAKTYDGHGNAVGYVTNAIEGGHRVRTGSGPSRARMQRVPGKWMYRGTDSTQIAAEARDEIAREMIKSLEG